MTERSRVYSSQCLDRADSAVRSSQQHSHSPEADSDKMQEEREPRETIINKTSCYYTIIGWDNI